MTAPVEACIEFERHSQTVKQEASIPGGGGDSSAFQHEHMAATTIETPWTTFQSLYQNDDGYANALSSDHASFTWPSSPAPSSMPMQNNYQLETVPEQYEAGSYATSIASWQTAYNNVHTPQQQMYIEQDQARPRTFPNVDLDQVHFSGFNGNTIVPQQLHPYDPPRSDPYQYVGDEAEMYPQQAIRETIEEMSPVHQQATGYDDYYQDDHSASYRSTPIDDDIGFGDDDDLDNEKHEPYAKTLYRCLRDAPNHTMVLRDIYEWFKTNTSRGKEPHEKGWQNSIRHNLSMNQAFEKIENTASNEPSRRGYQWRLTDQALREGRVQSTTRFRNKQPNKRGSKSHNPAPQRQMSGRRGGEASRYSAVHRRSQRLRNSQRDLPSSYHHLRSHAMLNHEMPVMGHVSPSSAIATYNGSVSPVTSPYPGYEPAYDWAAQMQPPMPSAAPVPGVMQHEQYMVTSNPASARDTPEIVWHEPGDTVFGDSDATSTTPATPSSFGVADLHQNPFGVGTNDCGI